MNRPATVKHIFSASVMPGGETPRLSAGRSRLVAQSPLFLAGKRVSLALQGRCEMRRRK